MNIIRNIIWRLTWRKKLCWKCSNVLCVSNHSPCYQCVLGCNYEENSQAYEANV